MRRDREINELGLR